MTRRRIALLPLSFLAIGTLCAQTLTVRVSNIRPIAGNLVVGVFNSEAGFPDVYYKGKQLKATDTVMVVTFTGLPKGKYAVGAYLDGNKNSLLDKNIFGVPKEKYGLSNKGNKPDYKASLFDFAEDVTVSISLK
jgi:uncharacterized protein (DUF2141 family)